MNLQIKPIMAQQQQQQRTNQNQSIKTLRQDVNFKGVFTKLTDYNVADQFWGGVGTNRGLFLQEIVNQLANKDWLGIKLIIEALEKRGLAKGPIVYPNRQEIEEFKNIIKLPLNTEQYLKAISTHAVEVINNATEITKDNCNSPEILKQFI